MTNDQLGELLEPDRPAGARQDYEHVLTRSFTWIGAFHGDRLVGYVNVAWDGGVHAFLLDPTVHPEFRGQGIGTRLVREALAAAAEHPRLEWMHVDASEELMERFYRPVGFRSTPAGLVWLADLRES